MHHRPPPIRLQRALHVLFFLAFVSIMSGCATRISTGLDGQDLSRCESSTDVKNRPLWFAFALTGSRLDVLLIDALPPEQRLFVLEDLVVLPGGASSLSMSDLLNPPIAALSLDDVSSDMKVHVDESASSLHTKSSGIVIVRSFDGRVVISRVSPYKAGRVIRSNWDMFTDIVDVERSGLGWVRTTQWTQPGGKTTGVLDLLGSHQAFRDNVGIGSLRRSFVMNDLASREGG